uniref:LPS translocon maturation chaperone LptM n=1 Tax=Thiolapillus sp. TaxID=2017437 RepID=UPI0027391ADF
GYSITIIRIEKNAILSGFEPKLSLLPMKMRHILLLVLLLLPLALSGCGNKGPLYMPEPEKKSN